MVSLLITWAWQAPPRVQEKLATMGRKPGNFKIAMFDISRAHFYGKAKRRIFVELEEESRKECGEDKCGLLLEIMVWRARRKQHLAGGLRGVVQQPWVQTRSSLPGRVLS